MGLGQQSTRSTLDTVSSLLKTHEPLMSHQYVILSVGDPSKNSLKFPKNFFQERVESLELPFRTFNVESRHIETTQKYYAGYNQFTAFSCTFYEDHKASALQGFMSWQQLIVNEQGDYFPASRYQVTMTIGLSDISDAIIATADLEGVFPTQITSVTMTGTEVQRITLQVSFSVNRVKWNFLS